MHFFLNIFKEYVEIKKIYMEAKKSVIKYTLIITYTHA